MEFTFSPEGWRLLRVVGPDAVDFLHRVTSRDFRSLSEGDGGLGFVLKANARIQAAFWVRRLPDGAWLATPDPQGLRDALEKLHFREQLEISEVAGHAVRLVWSDRIEAARLVEREAALVPGRELSTQEFTDLRVDQSFPWPGAELTEDVTPPEAGALAGVSRDKGCYPGQEVVEKMLSGRTPRRLACLSAAEAAHLPEGDIKVTTRSSDGRVLALVRHRLH